MSNEDNSHDDQEEDGIADGKVEIYHRVNRLKKKAGGDPEGGPGYFSADSIHRAQRIIHEKEPEYTDEVKVVIDEISAAWDGVQNNAGEEREKSLEALYHAANHIKDLASLFHYELMKHFGQSLRDFCEKVDPDNKMHHIIVKAHVDVMLVAYNENIHSHGGDKAEELKLIVAKAIEKYS
jgi:hypothetical protein